MADFYTGIGNSVRLKLDLKRIERERPQIAKLLRENATKSNQADKEKLIMQEAVGTSVVGTGAGNAPDRAESVGKWVNTVDSIDKFDVVNTSGGDFGIGSFIEVWGSN